MAVNITPNRWKKDHFMPFHKETNHGIGAKKNASQLVDLFAHLGHGSVLGELSLQSFRAAGGLQDGDPARGVPRLDLGLRRFTGGCRPRLVHRISGLLRQRRNGSASPALLRCTGGQLCDRGLSLLFGLPSVLALSRLSSGLAFRPAAIRLGGPLPATCRRA